MLLKEIQELQTDISDAFYEFGVIENKNKKITVYNILWKSQQIGNFDSLYKQSKNPIFNDFPMFCLGLDPVKVEELTNEGLDNSITMKTYIPSTNFNKYDILPKKNDRIVYKNSVYDVIKVGENIQIADTSLVLLVYLREATLSAQSNEIRQKNEPTIEIDADIATDIILYPARIIFNNNYTSYVINNKNNYMYLRYNNTSLKTLILTQGTYTKPGFISLIKALLLTNFQDNLILVDNGINLEINSKEIGKDATIDIVYIENNCYSYLGLSVGKYRGTKVIPKV